MASECFTTQMRKATRDIHAVSDALVNAKLFFALSDNSVWAEGLQVFYEIFRFLEESKNMYKEDNLGILFVDGLERTDAFENDLKFYLGDDWKANYNVRESVAEYLLHLTRLRDEDPDLLMAYVYHLYMGLLSGGQILTRKRQIKESLRLQGNGSVEGYAITDFGENTIANLKHSVKSKMNEIAVGLSEEKKELLLCESKKVFEWNNKIIKSVKGANRIILEKIAVAISFTILVIFLYNLFLK